MPDAESYDVFFSYRRVEREDAGPILHALKKTGLRVWLDTEEIAEDGSISDGVLAALAESKLVVAFYSTGYPQSRACRRELTPAVLAGQAEGDENSRVFAINPEPGTDHLEPVALRDVRNERYVSSDPRSAERLAQRIAEKCASITGPIGATFVLGRPRWIGRTPVGSSRFVGRWTEMWALHSALSAPDFEMVHPNPAQPVQLWGLPGIGKTLLVEEYGRRFGSAYPGGVFWLDAGGGSTADAGAEQAEMVRQQEFRRTATSLGERELDEDPDLVEAAIRARIDQGGEPCLWIVDDLPAGLDEAGYRRWMAPHQLARVVVTLQVQAYGALGTVVPLQQLREDEALELLTNGLGEIGDEGVEAAQAIVEEVGAHPLAIDVTAGAIDSEESLREWSRALLNPTDDELEFAAELGGLLPTGHEKSVATTLFRAIDRLPEEGRDVLRLASVLSKEPLRKELIRAVAELLENGPATEAWRWTKRALDATRDRNLTQLASRDPEADRVHALVARTIRYSRADRRRAGELREAALEVLTQELSSDAARTRRGRERLRFDVAHAIHLAARPSSQSEAALSYATAVVERDRGAPRATIALTRAIIDHWQLSLPDSHRTIVDALLLHTEALLAAGETRAANDAVERLQATAAEAGHKLKADHLHAEALDDLGQLQEAALVAEDVWKRSRDLYGPDAQQSLVLGNAYANCLNKLGRYRQAVDFLRSIVSRMPTETSRDREDLCRVQGNLGMALRSLGQYPEAIDVLATVVRESEELDGPGHPAYLAAVNNLGLAFDSAGRTEESVALFEEVVAKARKALGETHPSYLKTLSNYAGALLATGHLVASLGEYDRALWAGRDLDETHRLMLATRSSRAHALLSCGAVTAALEEHRAAYEGLREQDPEHPETLIVLSSIAGDLAADGRAGEALPICERVLAARRRILGGKHPDTLNAENNLAHVLFEQGAVEEAAERFEATRARRLELLGADHPDTMSSANNLAAAHLGSGDVARALAGFERLRKQARRANRERLPNTIHLRQNIADCLHRLGEHSRALAEQAACLAACETLFGVDSPLTLGVRLSQAALLRKTDEPGRSLKMVEAVASRVATSNPYNLVLARSTAWARHQCLTDLGRTHAARELYLEQFAWLIERDPDSLSKRFREMRETLLAKHGPPPGAQAGRAT